MGSIAAERKPKRESAHAPVRPVNTTAEASAVVAWNRGVGSGIGYKIEGMDGGTYSAE